LARLLFAATLTIVAGIEGVHAQTRPAPKGAPATAPLRTGFALPAAGETRFVPNEVILAVPAGVPTAALDAIAARHTMTRLVTQSFRLTGRRLHVWRLDGGGTVQAMIRGLSGERQVAGAQPNYLYSLMQDERTLKNGDQ